MTVFTADVQDTVETFETDDFEDFNEVVEKYEQKEGDYLVENKIKEYGAISVVRIHSGG